MSRTIGISQARARLPELAEYLRGSPHRVVLIEHRNMKQRLALISESHLRYLESLAAAEERRQTTSFKLAGSMASDLSDDDVDRAISAIKAEHQASADQKLRSY